MSLRLKAFRTVQLRRIGDYDAVFYCKNLDSHKRTLRSDTVCLAYILTKFANTFAKVKFVLHARDGREMRPILARFRLSVAFAESMMTSEHVPFTAVYKPCQSTSLMPKAVVPC